METITKQIDLQKSWRIALHKKKRTLTQYIEAETLDDAINKAMDTFSARLYGFTKNDRVTSKEGQKACKHSKMTQDLTFSFGSGHTTIYASKGLTIFEALEEVNKNTFTDGKPITEIETAISYWLK